MLKIGLSRKFCAICLVVVAGTASFPAIVRADAGPLPAVFLDHVRGALYAASPQSDPLIFRFSRTALRRGGEVIAHLRYDYADGRPAVRETVVYDDAGLTRYSEQNLQNGSHGEVRVDRAGHMVRVSFAFSPGGGQAATRHNLERFVSGGSDVLVDDGVVPFILRHWSDLSQGRSVRLRYVVLSRTETIDCALRQAGKRVWRGVPAVDISMAPTGFLARLLVKPVHFIMAQDGAHRLLEYRGRTLPKVAHDGQWQNLDAVTVFHWAAPQFASADQARGTGRRAGAAGGAMDPFASPGNRRRPGRL